MSASLLILVVKDVLSNCTSSHIRKFANNMLISRTVKSHRGEVNFPKVAIKSVHLWLTGKVPPLTSSFSTKFQEYLVAAFRLKQLDKTISRLNY